MLIGKVIAFVRDFLNRLKHQAAWCSAIHSLRTLVQGLYTSTQVTHVLSTFARLPNTLGLEVIGPQTPIQKTFSDLLSRYYIIGRLGFVFVLMLQSWKRIESSLGCPPSHPFPVIVANEGLGWDSLLKVTITRRGDNPKSTITHMLHVWYIYLHVVDFYGKCR